MSLEEVRAQLKSLGVWQGQGLKEETPRPRAFGQEEVAQSWCLDGGIARCSTRKPFPAGLAPKDPKAGTFDYRKNAADPYQCHKPSKNEAAWITMIRQARKEVEGTAPRKMPSNLPSPCLRTWMQDAFDLEYGCGSVSSGREEDQDNVLQEGKARANGRR